MDGRVVAGIVLGAFFGFFTLVMSITAARYIFTNITNIDMLKRQHVFRLAVRIPPDTPTARNYHIITYPLFDTHSRTNGVPNGAPAHGPNNMTNNADHIHTTIVQNTVNGVTHTETHPQPANSTPLDVLPARDQRAKKTFAILETEPGENPWDQGYWRNWKSVMGNNVLEWLLPIRHSPCCNHESMESDYDFGPLVETLKRRYGLSDEEHPVENGIEIRNAGPPRVDARP